MKKKICAGLLAAVMLLSGCGGKRMMRRSGKPTAI